MIHYSKVIHGLASYVDNELVASLSGSWKAWVLGGMAGLAISRAEQIFREVSKNAFVAALGLVEGENINTDLLFSELRKQAQRGTATATLPVIGPVTFGPSDVEALFHHIKEA